jgi:hypothetical protein
MSALLVAGVRCGVRLGATGVAYGRIRSIGELTDSTAIVRLDRGEVVEVPWQRLVAEPMR